MQNLRRDKISISLYSRALSTRRNPVTARRCFGTPARATTVGAPSSPLWEPRRRAPLPPGPEGQPRAVASGAAARMQAEGAASPQSSAQRRGWVPPSRAPRLSSAACVVGERLAMRVCGGRRRWQAYGGLAPRPRRHIMAGAPEGVAVSSRSAQRLRVERSRPAVVPRVRGRQTPRRIAGQPCVCKVHGRGRRWRC